MGVLHLKNVLLVLAAVLLTPIIALIAAWIGLRLLYWAASELTQQTKIFFQAAESLMFIVMSFAHGANAAQKSMALLVLGGLSLGQRGPLPAEFFLPVWVQAVCAAAFAAGVLLGFTRTLKKVGFGIFRVETLHSLCALAVAGSLTIVSTVFGLPLSSGQINTSALMGAGAGHNFRAVRWDIAAEFFANWMLTLPCTGVMAFLLVKLIE